MDIVLDRLHLTRKLLFRLKLVRRCGTWCIQYITNIPDSVLTGDVNAHSTLWHSYTDDHRGQLIADVISNSDHITLNTNTPTRVPNTTLQQTSSPDITTVSNTLYNRTSWTTQHALSSISGNIGLPPLARVMGVGRQQQVWYCHRNTILTMTIVDNDNSLFSK